LSLKEIQPAHQGFQGGETLAFLQIGYSAELKNTETPERKTPI
jgi:hypothetical protein